MSQKIQAIRGMNDILPEQSIWWQWVEENIIALASAYGYQEIRPPVVEKTELFKRSIGEVTDIVEKEMYTFEDRNGDSLTLRPEGTAGCVRAVLEGGLIHNQSQRLWYRGPMFRHERPQQGRYRQFYQLGMEAFGFAGPDIDAELILITANLWQRLGLTSGVTLQLNSLGDPESRARYREQLVAYYQSHHAALDDDSRRRLESNPLRILDSKNRQMVEINRNAPQFFDHLDHGSREHFDQLCRHLERCGIAYEINPRLVRGLDYYSKTVFEWVTDRLGAQGTICAGGRYDGLIPQLGGRESAAVGFALGMERLILLLQQTEEAPPLARSPHAYLLLLGDAAQQQGVAIAEKLRQQLPRLRLTLHCGGGSLKSQFKQADRRGAEVALILGDDEVASATIGFKPLRERREQQQLTMSQLHSQLQQLIEGEK
ncbi:MAG: histidine--tRNA ligase [Gammaproteobacteria bacterium]|nr:histidine--tRNA ligase [Gammaproteobacteria bacterium]